MSFIVPALPLRGASLPNLSLSERAFRAVLTVELWMERSSQRRALRELPECVMHDLALSQADVESEAGKPFWKA
jgi:uncharacterized protein YjiS (DUF1127 family)